MLLLCVSYANLVKKNRSQSSFTFAKLLVGKLFHKHLLFKKSTNLLTDSAYCNILLFDGFETITPSKHFFKGV